MRRGGGLVWVFMVGYAALLGWLLFVADQRFLRRAAVDIWSFLGDNLPGAVRPVHVEFLLYFLVFVPLGWLLINATSRPLAYVAVGCVWLAVMIEFAQTAFVDRSASPVQVIVSSAGAMLGSVLGRERKT